MSVQHISDQRPAFEAALRIARQHPTLPAAYTSVSRTGGIVSFQIDSLSGWELWRQTLAVDPSAVQVSALGTGDLLVSFDVVTAGFDVHVYVIDQIRSVVRAQAEEQSRAARQQASREDTYTSPLRHDYKTPHDLPSVPEQRDRRHA